MPKTSTDTPLMQQHRAIKQKYPDAILLFRVGDFYETFGEDAITAARVLGITLTRRNNGGLASNELAGFPYHSLDTYLPKLVKAGFRVAVCDQLEDPKSVKGIVKRGVTEMVTPGTATQDKLLEQRSNNFLAAIHSGPQAMGIAFLDLSTGEFFLTEGDAEYMDKLLQTLQPSEVIFQRQQQKWFRETFGSRFFTYSLESWIFEEAFARDLLLRQFETHSLKGFGVESFSEGLVAAGAIIHYLKETEHPHLGHISSLQRLNREDYLWMDRFSIRNLELFPTGDQPSFSLLSTLDNTISPMGARLLKRWMLMPLKDLPRINERLDLVEFLIREPDLRNQIGGHLERCGDLERLLSKIPSGRINPREMQTLARSMTEVLGLADRLNGSPEPYLARLAAELDPAVPMALRIEQTLTDQPPVLAARGNVVREGVNAELDHLRRIANGGKQYLAELQQKEAENTGISSLRISFNSVFGYYLEVTHSHRDKVPASWIRKQTLANAERYITPELKEYEEQITGAEEKILQLETGIYNELISSLQEWIRPIQQDSRVLAILDCLVCFAGNALLYNYRRPALHEGHELALKGSRHPVIEKNLPPGTEYIPNDIRLDDDGQQIIILTGPNMSGKSALLRQTALITLMAHMGSFVPAEIARIPLTDKIFTRVGASDNLSAGESTFLVEMNETASILNNITARSLIILDEIGRGTSTYDGISIAWSIAEYLYHSPNKPRTLFATHYHELNELEKQFPGIKNYHISSRETGNRIIFLRKMVPGGSTHSFGIHVARMAGMPESMVLRAEEMLRQLEKSRSGDTATTQAVQSPPAVKMQLSIFDAHTETFDQIRHLLNAVDIDTLTPVGALVKLNEVKALLK